MTIKYFTRTLDNLTYAVFESIDANGKPITCARQLDSTNSALLESNPNCPNWEYIFETDVDIDNFYVDIETDEFGMTDEDYNRQYDEPESTVSTPTLDSSKLKRMLKNLRRLTPEEEENLPQAVKDKLQPARRTEYEKQMLDQDDIVLQSYNMSGEYMALVARLRGQY
jgi:hypothetical protein